LLDVQRINGPDTVGHYNVYPAALIQGATLPGVSSGQRVTAGNTALFIFALCVLFVFLALALNTRTGRCRWPSFTAMAGIYLRGQDNNILKIFARVPNRKQQSSISR
jgi:multidrug efflux pump